MSPELFLLLILAPIGLLTTAYVIWPLLRTQPGAGTPAGGDAAARLNREIVLERRAQLERELAQLPPDSPERDRLILEFSTAALADLKPQDAKQRRAEPKRRLMAVVLAALIAVAPISLYWRAGAPDAASPDFAQRAQQPQDLPALVAELERRLQADPLAADGWLLLGRSRMSLGDLAGATAALERALAIDSPDATLGAQIRVDLADALAQGASSRLAGRPWQLIQDALKRDGANQKALALAGAYHVTQGNRPAALSYWEPLLAQLPAGSEQHAQIAAFVDDLKAARDPGQRPGSEGGQRPPPAAGPAATAAAGGTSARAGGSAAAAGDAAGTRGPAAPGPVLRGRVEIDPAVAGRMRAEDTLFIAARGVDAEGRPAGPPAAVLRARAGDLPLDFEMTDRDAMSPAAKLSGQSRIVVVARISRAGAAAGSAGDLEGRSQPVAPDMQGVFVRIDRVLE